MIKAREWLGAWMKIGFWSFGGGASVLLIMRRVATEEKGWLSREEFNRCYSLSQIVPGTFLIALSILIGRRVGGFFFAALAVLGLLLPGACCAVLLSMLLLRFPDVEFMQKALRGVYVATMGIGFAVFVNMAKPLVQQAKDYQPQIRLLFGLLFLMVLALSLSANLPIPILLLCSGFFWLALGPKSSSKEDTQ